MCAETRVLACEFDNLLNMAGAPWLCGRRRFRMFLTVS